MQKNVPISFTKILSGVTPKDYICSKPVLYGLHFEFTKDKTAAEIKLIILEILNTCCYNVSNGNTMDFCGTINTTDAQFKIQIYNDPIKDVYILEMNRTVGEKTIQIGILYSAIQQRIKEE